MYHRTNNRQYMTRSFKDYLNDNLNKIYGENHNIKPVQESIRYTIINDSDKPGIIECIVFTTTDKKSYEAAYWHNDHYRSFKSVAI